MVEPLSLIAAYASLHEAPGPIQDPKRGDGNQDDLKKQSPIPERLDKKRVSDLSLPEPKALIGGWLQIGKETTILLAADRESSLHPEHDPDSPSYSGRVADGPRHGANPHGDAPHGPDPHDEVHDSGLPANCGGDSYGGTIFNGRTPY